MSKVLNTMLLVHGTLALGIVLHIKYGLPLVLVILGAVIPTIIFWTWILYELTQFIKHERMVANKEGE